MEYGIEGVRVTTKQKKRKEIFFFLTKRTCVVRRLEIHPVRGKCSSC